MLFVTSPSQNDIASAQEREEYDLQIKDLEKDLDDIKKQIRIASEHLLHGDFRDDH